MQSCRLALMGIAVLSLACCSGGGSSSPVPDFALQDLNPNSATYLEIVSPRDHMQHATAWYFGTSTWDYCRSQLGYLEMMQAEMENEGHAMPVHVAGVNEPGNEATNGAFTVGLGLPWLQDTAEALVGASWNAEHFDLVIVGPDNVRVAVFDLVEYDLSDPANYEEIKSALAAAAGRRGPWATVGAAPQGPGGPDLHGDPGHGGVHGSMPDGMHTHDPDQCPQQDMHGRMTGETGAMHDDAACAVRQACDGMGGIHHTDPE